MADTVERRWIILLREGQAPEVKRPVNTYRGMWEMLEEIYRLYPTIKVLSVEVTWDGQLWVCDGKEKLKSEGNDVPEIL